MLVVIEGYRYQHVAIPIGTVISRPLRQLAEAMKRRRYDYPAEIEMTDEFYAVSEDELHAYVDGHLSPLERERVEAWLGRHPAHAEEVRQWQAQSASLKSLFTDFARSGPTVGRGWPEAR